MPLSIADAELRVYHPNADQPHVSIPGRDLDSVTITERGQGAIDQGSFTIPNDHGRYDGVDITAGDRLELWLQLAGESQLNQFWTAVAKPPRITLAGGTRRSIEIGARDFVSAVLSWRRPYVDFEDAPIAGSPDAIVDSLLREEAPEIDRSQIGTVARETDTFVNGRDLRTVLVEDLAPIADAVIAQEGTALVFEPLQDVSVKYSLMPEDLRGSIDISGNDDDLATLVRVDGGTAHDTDDEQLSQSATTRVTRSDRIMTQVQTRKSEVDRVQVWTDPDDTSPDKLAVRLQSDRGGAPVAVELTESDIASKRLSPEFLADGGLTTFLLPSHTLAPNDNPWVIVEATGSTGHLVGTDGNGNLTYQAEYPYPLLTRARDEGAAGEYRRRDHRIRDDTLGTFAAVRDTARSHLQHNTAPTRTIDGEAESVRAHRLQPGDIVDTGVGDWSGAPVTGTYLVTRRSTTIDAESTMLSTELSLQEASSL
jgi:hypothetical protein